MQVDRELALAAEKLAAAKPAEAKPADAPKDQPKDAGASAASADEGILARTPYAESVRLGHVLYALPGKYTVEVALAGARSETALEITAPEARKPRAKPQPKVRGKGGWPGTPVAAPAQPMSREHD